MISGRKIAAILLSLLWLLLLLPVGHAEAAVPEQQLADYAKIQADLFASADGDPLPQYVEDKQYLFFRLSITDFNSAELAAYLKDHPVADFFLPLHFTDLILEGTYPTKFDDTNNLIVDEATNASLCRWWITNDSIRIRFVDDWVQNATSGNEFVTNITANMSFDGLLNGSKKNDSGQFMFKVGNQEFPLTMKAGYTLKKSAGTVDLNTLTNQYEVPFSVTFTVDQDMINATPAKNDTDYKAVLKLVDTLTAPSAMTGTIVQGPTMTTTDGNTALTILNVYDSNNNSNPSPSLKMPR